MKKLGVHTGMREVYDFCHKWNLENLAQGVTEISPPQILRELASDLLKEDSPVHSYRYPHGEKEYRDGLVKMLKDFYHVHHLDIEHILATSGVTFGQKLQLSISNFSHFEKWRTLFDHGISEE